MREIGWAMYTSDVKWLEWKASGYWLQPEITSTLELLFTSMAQLSGHSVANNQGGIDRQAGELRVVFVPKQLHTEPFAQEDNRIVSIIN